MISSPVQVRPATPLPILATPFVGRQAELDELHHLLTNPRVHLITIFGAGGIGKTRLALEAAQRHSTLFSDGTYLITLAEETNTDQFVLMLSEVLSFQTQPDDDLSPVEQIMVFVTSRALLLILENAEYMADAAMFLGAVVESAPNVKILATSRQRLNLSSETVVALNGMRVNDEETADVVASDGVRLFLESARRVQPSFELSPINRSAVVRICQLTQGMPLAILLAASWLPLLSPSEIVLEMQRNLDILQTDLRDIPERQRSIRAVFDASWSLLKLEEQQVLLRLAVFTNGFTRAAAEQVAGGDLKMLMTLFNKSVVQRLVSTGRYELHELLRQYVLERLQQSGDSALAYAAHSRYFLTRVAQLEPQLKGEGQLEALDTIEADFDNIRAAWLWAVEHVELEGLKRALNGMFWYNMMRNRYATLEFILARAKQALTPSLNPLSSQLLTQIELRFHWMRRWREGSLVNPNSLSELNVLISTSLNSEATVDRVMALILRGDTLYATDDSEEAARSLHEAYTTAVQLHENFYAAWALHFQARHARHLHGVVQSLMLGRQAVEVRRAQGDMIGVCYSLYNVSTDLLLLGHLDESRQAAIEQLELSRMAREYSSTLMSQITLSLLALIDARFEEARVLNETNAKLASEINHGLGVAWAKLVRGLLLWFDGDFSAAFELLNESVDRSTHDTIRFFVDWGFALIQQDGGDSYSYLVRSLQYAVKTGAVGAIRLCLPAWAMREAANGNPEKAASLLGLAEGTGGWLPRWLDVTSLSTKIKQRLGVDGFDDAYERGMAWELEAVARGLLAEQGGDNGRNSLIAERILRANEKLTEPLSDRELEVMFSIARGFSNRDIADQLVVELSTIKKHLTHIYGKLGVLNRTQAILRAQQLGLV